jgi:hypothetical protein
VRLSWADPAFDRDDARQVAALTLWQAGNRPAYLYRAVCDAVRTMNPGMRAGEGIARSSALPEDHEDQTPDHRTPDRIAAARQAAKCAAAMPRADRRRGKAHMWSLVRECLL